MYSEVHCEEYCEEKDDYVEEEKVEYTQHTTFWAMYLQYTLHGVGGGDRNTDMQAESRVIRDVLYGRDSCIGCGRRPCGTAHRKREGPLRWRKLHPACGHLGRGMAGRGEWLLGDTEWPQVARGVTWCSAGDKEISYWKTLCFGDRKTKRIAGSKWVGNCCGPAYACFLKSTSLHWFIYFPHPVIFYITLSDSALMSYFDNF